MREITLSSVLSALYATTKMSTRNFFCSVMVVLACPKAARLAESETSFTLTREACAGERSLKPEHILHVVKPGLFLCQPLCGAQRALREGVAAMGAMDEFEALADAAENHGMFTDNIAGADREQRNFFFPPLADDPFTAIDHDFAQVAAEGVCRRLAESQRGAAWRIFFEPVVRLDNFDIVIIAESLCGIRHQ